MNLPFTAEQFFAVFADYNRALIGAVAGLWIATLAMLVFTGRRPSARSRGLSLFLSALWVWNGLVYHAAFFSRINPAARWFAVGFVLQAALFALSRAGRRTEYFAARGVRGGLAIGLMAYALAYPFLTMALGHPYPATPTFGVPCPTDILTIGLLLSSRGGVPLSLAVIPVVWALIGGSAAALLSVPTDYVLLGAGIALTLVVIGQHVGLRRAG